MHVRQHHSGITRQRHIPAGGIDTSWITRRISMRFCRTMFDRAHVPELMRHNDHDKLMHTRTQQERSEHGAAPREFITRHRWSVDMSEKEGVDGFVPLARKFIPRSRVPPALITQINWKQYGIAIARTRRSKDRLDWWYVNRYELILPSLHRIAYQQN